MLREVDAIRFSCDARQDGITDVDFFYASDPQADSGVMKFICVDLVYYGVKWAYTRFTA